MIARLRDSHPRTRRAALEALEARPQPPSPRVRQVVEGLAASDPDSIVKGRAELLLIEWGSSGPLPSKQDPSPSGPSVTDHTRTSPDPMAKMELPPSPELPSTAIVRPAKSVPRPRTAWHLEELPPGPTPPDDDLPSVAIVSTTAVDSMAVDSMAPADMSWAEQDTTASSWDRPENDPPIEKRKVPTSSSTKGDGSRWSFNAPLKDPAEWDEPFHRTGRANIRLSAQEDFGDLVEADVSLAPTEDPVAGRVKFAVMSEGTNSATGDESTARLATSDEELSERMNQVNQPDVLYRPNEQPFANATDTEAIPDFYTYVLTPRDATLGFAGPSGVAPSEYQQNGHFVPIEDRWRIGSPYWDRYDKGFPPVDDYPYKEGHWYDPYNQNVLKGDYPIIGQHTFLNITASTQMLNELRAVPTPTTPFESTVDPFQQEFFGNPQQYFYRHDFKLSFDLFHGAAAFKPVDWRIKVSNIFNLNYLDVNELGVVNPNVLAGTTRSRQDYALEEWFVEKKLADLSPDYDFVSARVGSQNFNSDFRGFIFSDINLGARVFGTRNANRDQFNLAVFDMREKDTNSGLNTFDDREQTVVIANYYRQDFIFPGYTAQTSFHYNNDGPSFRFDRNNFLVRPDPVGTFNQHRVEAYYMGLAGDGHIERFNYSNAFYWVLGRDSMNPLAGREQFINAQMAALEVSYDRDWVRFRSSFFWASGDDNIFDKEARGFDAILDNPAFAGGGFSYWQRQALKLFNVNLTQRESLLPDLRSSKTQGQSNFVNPGLFLYNVGFDADITPKLRMINNANFLWFNKTEILERFLYQDNIEHYIGVDLSSGFEYRPFLNDNVILVGGLATLLPGAGFDDLFGKTEPFTTQNATNFDSKVMYQAFLDIALTF